MIPYAITKWRFKSLALCLLLLFSTTSFSQTETNAAVDETCKCLEQSGLKSETITDAEFNDLLSKCMEAPLMKRQAKLAKEANVMPDAPDVFEKIGMNMGAKLMVNCKIFAQMVVAKQSREEAAKLKDLKGKIVGKFLKTEGRELNYLYLETEGTEVSFLWLESFAGSDQLEKGDSFLQSKTLEITWVEKSIYSPVIKGYKNQK